MTTDEEIFTLTALFQANLKRLQTLEKWRELAIRPSLKDCAQADLDLMAHDLDDLHELSARCDLVRNVMNANLPPLKDPYGDSLVPLKSSISNAGLGLYFKPSIGEETIEAGETICYYRGHIHNYHSAKSLSDRDYLMLVRDDILVDPGPLKGVLARYINDPLNDSFVNCVYVPQTLFSAVVATRNIYPGEELFVSYGDAYWSQQSSAGCSIE